MVILTKETERQKRLIYLLVIILVITGLVWWYGFFQARSQVEPMGPMGPEGPMRPVGSIEEVREIDFTILESPFFKELQPFEEIEPFKEEIGRENPFLPY